MTDDKRSSDPAAPRATRRPPPTIDLKPTAVETAGGSEQPPKPPVEDPQRNDPPAQEPPREDPPQQDPPQSPPPKEEPPGPTPQPAEPPRSMMFPMLASGVVGGVCASVLLWMLLPATPPTNASAQVSGVAPERVAALEAQLRELKAQPAPAVPDDVTQRLAKLEQTLATPPAPPAPVIDPTLLQRLDVAENALKSVGVALAAIGKRADDTAVNAEAAAKTASDASALVARIEALEQAERRNETDIAKAAEKPDAGARLAVSAAGLRATVASGQPFAAELAAMKSLGADGNTLSPLEPFAASGVPNEATLARELSALIPAMQKLAGADQASGDGFVEKLQANASKLVRIRPIGETAGDDAAAIISRIDTKAAKNDINGALADLNKLPPAARAPADDWIKRVDARNAALAASSKIAGDAVRTLGAAQ